MGCPSEQEAPGALHKRLGALLGKVPPETPVKLKVWDFDEECFVDDEAGKVTEEGTEEFPCQMCGHEEPSVSVVVICGLNEGEEL